MTNQIDEDEPLDPVMERVRVKMVRLLGISIGLMLLALITVLGAVVYKINQDSDAEDTQTDASVPVNQGIANPMLAEEVDVELPTGAIVITSALSGSRLMLNLLMGDGAQQVWIIDLQSGDVISRVTIN